MDKKPSHPTFFFQEQLEHLKESIDVLFVVLIVGRNANTMNVIFRYISQYYIVFSCKIAEALRGLWG